MKPYYQDNAVTIYHGDCREIVPALGMFDLLLTDPPYGIGRSGQSETFTKNPKHKRKAHVDCGWDNARPEPEVFRLLLSAAKKAVIWGGNYFADMLPPTMGWLYWDKGQNGLSMSDGELAWTSEQRALRAFVCNRSALVGSQHPTEKPLRLFSWCIGLAGDVQTILDPFAGSGTTGRAAKDLGRKATLIEREERYCEIAARRMAQEVLPLWPNKELCLTETTVRGKYRVCELEKGHAGRHRTVVDGCGVYWSVGPDQERSATGAAVGLLVAAKALRASYHYDREDWLRVCAEAWDQSAEPERAASSARWVRCEWHEAQQYRERTLTGSIGLEGSWSPWYDGRPDSISGHCQYEYRKQEGE